MSLKRRLEKLELEAELNDSDSMLLLAEVLGRRDAYFWPWRTWNGARVELRNELLAGSIGVSARAIGRTDWKSSHLRRVALIEAGHAVPIRSFGGEVNALKLTAQGEQRARDVCGLVDLSNSIVQIVYGYLKLMGDSFEWVSESRLWQRDLAGNPSDWDDLTELCLPLLTAGAIECKSNLHGEVFYRCTEGFFELPESVDHDAHGFSLECQSSYIKAFDAERVYLASIEEDAGIEIGLSCGMSFEKENDENDGHEWEQRRDEYERVLRAVGNACCCGTED